MSNYNESDFAARCKKFFSNRAVIVTLVALLAATVVIVAVTVAANRARKDQAETTDTLGTVESNAPGGQEGTVTLPIYNAPSTEPANKDESPSAMMSLPVSGKLFKDHDPTLQVYSATMDAYRVHLGVDIATEAGATVSAAAAGTVERVWDDAMMGTCVAIKHDGDVLTVYKNLAKNVAANIKEGVAVSQGQAIGTVGETAMLELADDPHLHFEVTVGGIAADPLDYFSKEAVATLAEDTAFEDSVGK